MANGLGEFWISVGFEYLNFGFRISIPALSLFNKWRYFWTTFITCFIFYFFGYRSSIVGDNLR